MVDYVAKQTKTSASSLGLYDWSGRTIERHRGEIRDHLGFRECSRPAAHAHTRRHAHRPRQGQAPREAAQVVPSPASRARAHARHWRVHHR
ncbi:DUF4158 domain-containing protein [Nonomuraea zeae]|uniref:DUF4158 domain-containing protein n=1 Tax=Nonomuraea zeae TaxID=1642303 RepID=A0A5S4GGV0_9ACTN|nr:DUF4158 domain-containing protein [Nonomuraea zeae]